MKKAYIAGKITNNPNYKQEFQKAEEYLKSQGYIVMNPATLNSGFEQEDYLHICMAMIDVCKTIFFLPNWVNSCGAKKEMKYSKCNDKEIQLLNEYYKTCPKCWGRGELSIHDCAKLGTTSSDYEITCPECNGTGKLKDSFS